MIPWRTCIVGLICFILGSLVQSGFAQSMSATYNPDLFRGTDPKARAAVLLDGALQLAGPGGWERMAVGRAWYLGGDKAKGQKIFDEVTRSVNVTSGDWFRLGRIYAEAGEWDKAEAAFDRTLAFNRYDDATIIEYGVIANMNNDRAKAEKLFAEVFRRNPNDFWYWVAAGGSYLGVAPR